MKRLISIIATLLVVALPACAQSAKETTRSDAAEEVQAIVLALPAYTDDVIMAPLETALIAVVQQDMTMAKGCIDDDDCLRHARRLEKDFDALVKLDKYLGEMVIL